MSFRIAIVLLSAWIAVTCASTIEHLKAVDEVNDNGEPTIVLTWSLGMLLHEEHSHLHTVFNVHTWEAISVNTSIPLGRRAPTSRPTKETVPHCHGIDEMRCVDVRPLPTVHCRYYEVTRVGSTSRGTRITLCPPAIEQVATSADDNVESARARNQRVSHTSTQTTTRQTSHVAETVASTPQPTPLDEPVAVVAQTWTTNEPRVLARRTAPPNGTSSPADVLGDALTGFFVNTLGNATFWNTTFNVGNTVDRTVCPRFLDFECWDIHHYSGLPQAEFWFLIVVGLVLAFILVYAFISCCLSASKATRHVIIHPGAVSLAPGNDFYAGSSANAAAYDLPVHTHEL